MKKVLLKIIAQIIYRFSEHTPAHVKHSDRNYKVAKAVLAIDELRNSL